MVKGLSESSLLWEARSQSRSALIELARSREASRRSRLSLSPWEDRLDPNALTIGFARRFATYKRANLIFSELDRLIASILESALEIQALLRG